MYISLCFTKTWMCGWCLVNWLIILLFFCHFTSHALLVIYKSLQTIWQETTSIWAIWFRRWINVVMMKNESTSTNLLCRELHVLAEMQAHHLILFASKPVRDGDLHVRWSCWYLNVAMYTILNWWMHFVIMIFCLSIIWFFFPFPRSLSLIS